MSQVGLLFLGPAALRLELPDATANVLPGVQWGRVEEFPSPAYWTYQVYCRRAVSGSHFHRLGKTLSEEVVACLLGGYGVPAQVGLAAFHKLRTEGFLNATPEERDLRVALSAPLSVGGREVHYRFAARKAAFIANALKKLQAAPFIPQGTGRALRDWLLDFEGIGPKTASWVARNWLDADDVAILDVHILRAGVLAGFLDPRLSVSRHYLELEEQFLRFSQALGVRSSELDAVIWQEMMSSPRSVRKLWVNVTAADSCN